MAHCSNAYRKKGDRKIYCRKIESGGLPLCGHVYYCRMKERYELSGMAERCRLSYETESGVKKDKSDKRKED